MTIALAGAATMVAFQLLGGPARYVIVSGHSMEPTLRTGDLALVLRQESYRRGDVVAYRVPDGETGAGGVVIHRVVGGSHEEGYVTQGDNRRGRDPWRPRPDDVIGSLAFHVPEVGRVPTLLGSALGLAFLAAVLAFAVVARSGTRRPDELC
ncbi:MAG: signal peptidase [Gaiellaceae bacterium]|jgi:signal peptidase I|nr:signal peptidase [Gaiellaceae bacterium]